VSKIREKYNQKIDEVRNDYSSKVKELLDEIQKVRNVSTKEDSQDTGKDSKD
jgi:hypothetical protein